MLACSTNRQFKLEIAGLRMGALTAIKYTYTYTYSIDFYAIIRIALTILSAIIVKRFQPAIYDDILILEQYYISIYGMHRNIDLSQLNSHYYTKLHQRKYFFMIVKTKIFIFILLSLM